MIVGAALILGLAAAAEQEPAPVSLVTEAATAPNEQREVVEAAFRYIGRPYERGGIGQPAFDCSGFVQRVFEDVGYVLPRVSRDQASVGRPATIDALAPGDLLFFARSGRPIHHVALYLGDGELIHASSGQGRVVVDLLSARWFQRHFVAARRVLGETLPSETRYAEFDEHAGPFALPPTLRRPARRSVPQYGLELPTSNGSSLGSHAAVLSEEGRFALTFAPEVSLKHDEWGFELTAAVPIRVPFGGQATIGRFETARDYLRFLRTLRLGLPGADVEVVVSRLGDLTLGRGALVDHAIPSTAVAGVPGLTVGDSPLASTAAWRGDWGQVGAVVDDVLDPRFFGAEAGLSFGRMTVQVAGATDRAVPAEVGRVAIEGAEVSVAAELIETTALLVDASVQGTLLSMPSSTGAAGQIGARAQVRFADADSLSLSVFGGIQGSGSMRALFGPTYLVHRRAHHSALEASGDRGIVGGAVRLDAGKWRLAAEYSEGVGALSSPFDRTVMAMAAIRGLSVGRSRVVDLRALYVARAIGREVPAVQIAQVGLRLRLRSWVSAEAYYQLGRRSDGGAGLIITLSV